jgi:hypothetical protein
VIEKLLENWLDSASERSYQPVFVQMLSGHGYRVVHSTRHTSLEFGKDVLAVAPDGTGCAYQLKGNPGGKLGLAQFKSEVQAQLVQLMSQPVVYPGFPSESHKAFLVSNGYFDEEVQRAVDDLNRGPYPSKVTLINRGDLLVWAKNMGTSLWPGELPDVRLLLELVFSDPKDLLPKEKLADLLGKVLVTGLADDRRVRKSEFERIVTSAALLTGIATFQFAEVGNHYAVACAWALLAVMIIASVEKHGHPLVASALETLELAEASALDALAALWEEVSERGHLIEGSALGEPEVYGWRLGLLLGGFSCLGIAHETKPLLNEKSATSLRQWLLKPHKGVHLWGEGAIANLAPWLIYMRKHDPTERPDIEIEQITRTVLALNQHDSKSALASPYYGFEEVIRSRVQGETFAGSSYTAEPLFHLLVRTKRKMSCKALWPEFTRLGHRGLAPAAPWQYCLLKVEDGFDETRIVPPTRQWDQLKAEVTIPGIPVISRELIGRSWLLGFWWQVAPHRFNSGSCRIFVESQIPGWGG